MFVAGFGLCLAIFSVSAHSDSDSTRRAISPSSGCVFRHSSIVFSADLAIIDFIIPFPEGWRLRLGNRRDWLFLSAFFDCPYVFGPTVAFVVRRRIRSSPRRVRWSRFFDVRHSRDSAVIEIVVQYALLDRRDANSRANLSPVGRGPRFGATEILPGVRRRLERRRTRGLQPSFWSQLATVAAMAPLFALYG